jgi:CBS domain-containing protein
MSLHDQKNFIKMIPPFDKLTASELQTLLAHINIAYYPKETTLLSPTSSFDFFYIIIKGEVSEYRNGELTFVYHEQDTFDADALIYNKTQSQFQVSEDLICYLIERATFLEMMQKNEKFKRFFLKNISARLQTLKNQEYGSTISTFMFSRVCDIFSHEPCIVSDQTPIKEAIEKSLAQNTSTIIIQRELDYGIVTDSLLKTKVLLANRSLQSPIGEIAHFPMISVTKDDFLFSVLLTLIKESIKRVAIIEEGRVIGVLKQADILSHFANHSHIVAVKISKATTIESLKEANITLQTTIVSLYNRSLKTNYIAKMVAELNRKMYAKLFSLILPAPLQEKSALLVMGSEGRDEQIMRSDQDNALIIADDQDPAHYAPYMQQFTQELIDFGFPECHGKIMVNNPYWCKNYRDFEAQIDQWLTGGRMEDYMELAIFFDAKCVAGDNTLLDPLKEQLFVRIQQRDVYMAYFANITLQFKTPIGLFSDLKSSREGIDIKKGGIFAIVHGVRALALENHITAHSTIARIKALHQAKVLEKSLASELIEAFGLLTRLRLQRHISLKEAHQPIHNLITIEDLSKMERDMLKDSFVIVNQFKKFISHHFHLGNLQ